MEIAFKASFLLAVVAEVALVAVLIFRFARREGRDDPRPPVFTGADALTGAALFGGTMTLTALLADGWSGLGRQDTLLYAVTFGIVTAGLAAYLRRRAGGRPAHGHMAFVLPLGFGVLAGLAGV
ncbi:MAG TPA: hypothetical protein VFH94_27960 [Streptomyces sp.]|nr:hypothetical protein [Streptomyces sp.]